ncbi:MAG TPA: hypothetical protein VH518_08210 [Tepidisphaeraceae bacterium]|jgi:hypothetical protein
MSNPADTPRAPILVLCRDLLLSSKITSAAQASSVPIKLLRDASKLAAERAGDRPRLIVDLAQPGFLQAATDWKNRTAGHVTGFTGHTDTETIAAAQAAGLDAVMARGAFVANLSAVLSNSEIS